MDDVDMDIDINEVEDYIIASRIALTVNCTDAINLDEIDTLLQILRQYLSCRVCHKLPDRLNPQFDGFICTVCINNHQTIENAPMSAIKKCYKALCDFIRASPLYDIICANDEDRRMVELVTEVFSVSHPINGHNLSNGVSSKQQTEVKDDLNSSSDVQLHKNNEKTDNSNVEFDMQSQKRKSQTLLNTVSTNKKKTERRGCRCGNTTANPGKLTCFGQRCPCYTEQKPCDDRCKCRGCRNPKPKSSNNDDDLEIDQIRPKPVIIVGSSIEPPLTKSKSAHVHNCRMRDMLQIPSHSQGRTEVTLGQKKHILQAAKETNHKKKKESSVEQESLNGKLNQEQKISENLGQESSAIEQEHLNDNLNPNVEKVTEIKDFDTGVSNLSDVNDMLKNSRNLRSRSNLRSNLNSENVEKAKKLIDFSSAVTNLYLLQKNNHILLPKQEEQSLFNLQESSLKQEYIEKFNQLKKKLEDRKQETSFEQDKLNGKLNPEQLNSENLEKGSLIEQESLNGKLNQEQKNSENLEQESSAIEQEHLNDKLNPNVKKITEIKDLDTGVSYVNDMLKTSRNLRSLSNLRSNLNSENVEKAKKLIDFSSAVTNLCLLQNKRMLQTKLEEEKESSLKQKDIEKFNKLQINSEDEEQGSSFEQEQLNGRLNPEQF